MLEKHSSNKPVSPAASKKPHRRLQRSSATNKPAININNKISKQQIPKEADDVINWPALQTRYRGRDALIKKLMATTLRTHNETPEKLRQAVLSKDVDTLHLTSHSLKGMAGFLEAAELQKLATRTEKETLDNNTDNIHMGNELAEVMEKLLVRLSDIMR